MPQMFSGPVWTFWKFLPSRSETKQLGGSDKIVFFAYQPIPRVPFFYIRTKFRLKNRVTTVHLLQCKTNFFIHLCF